MNILLGTFWLVISICNAQTDSSKWVWGNSRSRNDNTRIVNTEKRYNGELASFSKPLFQASNNYNGDRRLENIRYRYEVTETPYPSDFTSNTYRPRPPEQYRPDSSINKPFRPPPDYNRPYENEYRPLGNGYRPPNGDYSLHGLRPGVGTNGKPILTGPTPSWVEDGHHKYKDYDICKCVHSFNCNTPGIKFGSCDVDKQYCCYKGDHPEGSGGNKRPDTGYYERPRPVLAGPGGPVDIPGKPYLDKRPPGRPFRPEVDKQVDPERELNEAYKKGLASAIYELHQKPSAYTDRDPYGYKEYYQPDRDYYRPPNNFKSSHPTKYGLYDPSVGLYARSSNSNITAIGNP